MAIVPELNGAAPDSDTETWPNVYGIDFADRRLDDPLEDNQALPGREDFGAESDPARPLPAEPLVVPGLEDYTLLLEQGQPVNLMAGRPIDPVYCAPRTATRRPPPGITRKNRSQVVGGSCRMPKDWPTRPEANHLPAGRLMA